MRRLLFVSALALFATPALADVITVKTDGLVCAYCAQGIEELFYEQDEVKKVTVDVDKGLTVITTNGNADLSDERISKLIDSAGYKARSITRR